MLNRHVATPAVLPALVFSAALLLARTGGAVGINGTLDPEYGAALVTQTTQTGLSNGQIVGDNTDNNLNFANGSELDAGYAVVSGGVLYLFLSGNVAMELNVNQNKTVGHVLDIFIDSVPGGQNVLNGLGPATVLNGLTFDAGFEADRWLEFVGDTGGSQGPPIWTASYAALPSQGGGTLTTLGSGSAGGPGTLTGGTNPNGILVTIDNHNIGGVTFGCGPASGAGVTTGVEWAIPLAAIGNPTGCSRVIALVRNMGTTSAAISNQVLAPLPGGTCPPGPASTVNFASIAGDQFFTVCQSAADVPGAPAPRFALLGAGTNPTRGDRVRVAFELPDSRSAMLQLIDCAGRVVREQAVASASGGLGTADLSAGRRLAPGIYWLRLSQGPHRVARSLCVVR